MLKHTVAAGGGHHKHHHHHHHHHHHQPPPPTPHPHHHSFSAASGTPAPPTTHHCKPRSHSHSSAEFGSTHTPVVADDSAVATESRLWFHLNQGIEDAAAIPTKAATTAACAGRSSRRRNRSRDNGAAAAATSGPNDQPPDSGSGPAVAATRTSRRRPPSGAENAVRRWNSFHSTRGECHPNKFRRDRKSTSPSIDVAAVNRRQLVLTAGGDEADRGIGGGGGQQRKPLQKQQQIQQATGAGASSGGFGQQRQLLRGRSLATSDTVLLTKGTKGMGGGGCGGGGQLAGGAHQQRRHSQQHRAASVCLGNRFGGVSAGGRLKEVDLLGLPSNEVVVVIKEWTSPDDNASISRQSSIDGHGPSTDESSDTLNTTTTTTTSASCVDSSTGTPPAMRRKLGATSATAASYSAHSLKTANRGSHSSDTSSAYSTAEPDEAEMPGGIFSGLTDSQGVSFIDSDDDGIAEMIEAGGRGGDEQDDAGGEDNGDGDEEEEVEEEDHDDQEEEEEENQLKEQVEPDTEEHDDVDDDDEDEEEEEEEEEEDLLESIDNLAIRDTVRECLDKEPADRSTSDIDALLDFTKHLAAFANQTQSLRRALCAALRYAVVEPAGATVLADGELLDSWCVLINGHVEVVDPLGSNSRQLHAGDGFGIQPTLTKQYQRGVMRTGCADCQFVCVPQAEYCRIWYQGAENTRKHKDADGAVVLVTELRLRVPDSELGVGLRCTGGTRWGHVVIRGTPERLTQLLVEDIDDLHYAEDFLLTHRSFYPNPHMVATLLLGWFQVPATYSITTEPDSASVYAISLSNAEIRERIACIVLLWVNQHFSVDFEPHPDMMQFLDTLLDTMTECTGSGLAGLNRDLLAACSARARSRQITLARSARDEPLQFECIGGGQSGVFVASVEEGSKAAEKGLKRGDQICEVNGQKFTGGGAGAGVTLAAAREQLRATTHLSVTVRWNVLGFRALIEAEDEGKRTSLDPSAAGLVGRPLHGRRQTMSNITRLELSGSECHGVSDAISANRKGSEDSPSPRTGGKQKSKHFTPTRTASHIQKALDRINMFPRNAMNLLMEGLNPALCVSDDHINLRATASKIAASATHKSSSNRQSTGSAGGDSDTAHRIAACQLSPTPKILVKSSGGGANGRNSGDPTISLQHSQSNPDLTMLDTEERSVLMDLLHPKSVNNRLSTSAALEQPEHVLKIYRADQTSKYLLVFRETTAHEVVMLALQEFGCHESSALYSLCEVSVGAGGMIKQRRLPEQQQNLADRIGLASRYYLKTNSVLAEKLVPDDLAPDIVREATVHLLQLNANQLATQLTLQDYGIFRSIAPTEYIAELFAEAEADGKSGKSGGDDAGDEHGLLHQFAQLVNREMFWVITAVCSEPNMMRRMRVIKQFVKIARHCKECRNFNSMFALVSGLGHASVARLRCTWEKLPYKYHRVLSDLQELMDPTRNMNRYRLLLAGTVRRNSDTPVAVIPFYPVVKKDLTFIHLGNDSRGADGLVNFEKLRMLGKEVRALRRMCSADLRQLLDQTEAFAAGGFESGSPSTGGTGEGASGSASSVAMGALSQLAALGGGGGQQPEDRHSLAPGGRGYRRKKSATVLNPKRMFEEAQMVRRIKAYLAGMHVCSDEDELTRMSAECEALSVSGSVGGGSLGSVSGSSLTFGANSGAVSCVGGGGVGGGCGAAIMGRSPVIGDSGTSTGSSPVPCAVRQRGAASPTLSATSSTSSASESAQRLMAVSAAMVAVCGGTAAAAAQQRTVKPRRLTNPEEKITRILGPEALERFADESNGCDSVFQSPEAVLQPVSANGQLRTGSYCEVTSSSLQATATYALLHGRSNSDTSAASHNQTKPK